jgi:hypothetical protein
MGTHALPRTKRSDRELFPNGGAKPIEGPTPETARNDKAASRKQRRSHGAELQANPVIHSIPCAHQLR